MRKVLAVAVVALLALAVFVSCKKSGEGGRAGADTFRVTVPALVTDIKQGETQVVRVGLERSEEFKQAVKLEVKAPTGLQVDPDNTTVKPGDKGDLQLKITAAKDAPLGEQKIMVKGTPGAGEPTNTEFTMKVVAP
jgi:uncharacterized membrane protein